MRNVALIYLNMVKVERESFQDQNALTKRTRLMRITRQTSKTRLG